MNKTNDRISPDVIAVDIEKLSAILSCGCATARKIGEQAMFIVTSTLGDPTAKVGIARAYYSERTDMIERVAEQTDQQLAPYILKAVTEGWSYDILKVRLGIPCCKDTYYELYRRFFWLLNRERK